MSYYPQIITGQGNVSEGRPAFLASLKYLFTSNSISTDRALVPQSRVGWLQPITKDNFPGLIKNSFWRLQRDQPTPLCGTGGRLVDMSEIRVHPFLRSEACEHSKPISLQVKENSSFSIFISVTCNRRATSIRSSFVNEFLEFV